MAIFYATQTGAQVAAATAGLGGSPAQNRSNEDRSAIQVKHFSYTVPASSGPASGDSLVLARLKVTDRIYGIKLAVGALGAAATATLGKIDPNNSANTDASHYSGAMDLSIASYNPDALVTNDGEQVGADPAGDQTTGQTAPGFGQAPIQITMTFGGATPTAAAVIEGHVKYSAGDVG